MAMHKWIPDNDPRRSEQGQSSAPASYIIVPPLHLDKSSVLNIAGWSDRIPDDMLVCKTCKKQLPVTFLGLAIFPTFKANIDLFQFTYEIPRHKGGGAFSEEICKESGTNATRDFERPTCVRFLTGDQTPTNGQDKGSAQGTESVPYESKDDPLAVLKVRLAKGEITEQEFAKLVKLVGEGVGAEPEVPHEEVDQKVSKEELKKKLDGFSPQMAEERYDYLSSRSLGDLTDAEYEERLALVERLSEKRTGLPKRKSK